ncbi:hypothetical protein F6J84_14770 [Microbacterium caowuchunii]|uniref:hypothetical protein n=1 Tax=Microbacterium caowuchunii TaxID=2614638 RepID=UPI00124654CB|nr:hypothetical protein [Microbacterium caowuchunii]QEW01233.1 hypothetical protein F6J84_14770 [Microbacterium caowuchunii]
MTATTASSSATTRSPRPVRRTPIWAKALLVGALFLLVVGAGFAGVSVGQLLGADEQRSVQVTKALSTEEQVIFVTSGITGLETKRDNQDFFGWFDIPFSDREMFIQYDFDAKFGIEGQDVRIEPTGDKQYTVTIPDFVFLGYENPAFSVATESNGILSWTTPQIDTIAAVEEILTDEVISEHLEGVRPLLEVQATTFYERIVSSIDPDVELTFEFADN